jgi:hypothetical protein
VGRHEVIVVGQGVDMLVRVTSRDEAGAAYGFTLERKEIEPPPPPPPPPPPGQGRLSGLVLFEDRPYTSRGFQDSVRAPAQGVDVEVVRASDGVTLAQGATDSEGAYDLTFGLDGAAGSETVYVRALARRDMPDGVVEVRVPRTRELHAARIDGDVVVGAGESMSRVLFIPNAGSVGGAFNVIDVIRQGYELRWRVIGGSPDSDLTVEWQRGRAFGCGSCYSAGTMSLGGGDADPDEYDDSVIAHELGHFIAAIDSRDDSPGGYHDGSPAWPPLAWSEGYATFFGQWSLGDDVYFDSYEFGSSVDDVEIFDLGDAYGTEDGTASGFVSENLVTAVLWDLADEGENEAFDRVSRGDEALQPLFGYMPSARYQDRGADGAELYDYLDGWFCHGLGEQDDVRAVLEHREFPYAFDWDGAPGACVPPSKRSSPVEIEARRQGGEVHVVVAVRRPGRVELTVAGVTDGPLPLGTVEEGQRIELVLPATDGGGPLRGGVTLFGQGIERWHAPIRRPASSLTKALPIGARRVWGPKGELLEWSTTAK